MGLRGQGGRRSAAGATEVVEERSNPRGERARRMASEEGLARLACAAGVAVSQEGPQAEHLDLFSERAAGVDAGMTIEDGAGRGPVAGAQQPLGLGDHRQLAPKR